MIYTRNINDGWIYSDLRGQGELQTVNLPHTPRIEDLQVYRNYQTVMNYNKRIVPENYSNNYLYFLEFEGAMINAEVFANGKKLATHYGGYLPFIVDISSELEKGKGIADVIVTVDNRDDKRTPPGKVTAGLDFLYYGGLYRNVNLIVKNKIYITHPIEKDSGGGIKVHTLRFADSWTLNIDVDIANISGINAEVKVNATLTDGQVMIAELSGDSMIRNRDCVKVSLSREGIPAIDWNIENPKLYNLSVSVYDNSGKLLSEEAQTIGFREAKVDREGFKLNGRVIRLFGVNRHQQFPYVGIAASDEANRREARLLKNSGVNCLRLAHYPQSTAFLDECDRLGMIVIDCVPGWQFIGNKVWCKRLQDNVRDMVRRDRNHASVMIYEVTPNESPYVSKKGDTYMKGLGEIAKSECPWCITAGDTSARRDAEYVGYDIPYSGDDKLAVKRKLYPNGEKLFLRREYGDWAFGGNKSTSRVNRGDGETAMQIQAWNFQWSHNMNYIEGGIIGDIIWEGIDHNRGYYPKAPISTSGIFDIFRLPKLSYGLIASQITPTNNADYVIYPMVTGISARKKLPIYSNCDKIKLIVNGAVIDEITCDKGVSNPYDKVNNKVIDDNYWLNGGDHIATSNQVCNLAKHTISCLYDGGNCEKMVYPPYTFNGLNLKAEDKVEIIGYDAKGMEVNHVIIKEPLSAVALDINLSDWGMKLVNNDNDFIFVYVKAIDKNNIVDINYTAQIMLTAEGGSLIKTDRMNAEAGIASFMLKADKGANKVILTAQSGKFKTTIEYNI